uniref:Uncharacterized protein n=1 Tax=Megaselia scalaris TaxID=36166 RepID=T1GLB3_MEGSC
MTPQDEESLSSDNTTIIPQPSLEISDSCCGFPKSFISEVMFPVQTHQLSRNQWISLADRGGVSYKSRGKQKCFMSTEGDKNKYSLYPEISPLNMVYNTMPYVFVSLLKPYASLGHTKIISCHFEEHQTRS